MGKDLYQNVTDQMVAILETGVRPWHQPWAGSDGPIVRPLRHNGLPYNGVNILILWAEAMAKGYTSPFWFTFNQSHDMGGHVRKGEHGVAIVYASRFTKEDEDGTSHSIPFLKSYTVFNADQIEGLPEKFYVRQEPRLVGDVRDAACDAWFGAVPAEVRHSGSKAFYSISEDYVQVPKIEVFDAAEHYYATLAHELAHWTRHESRLNRDFGRKRWGDEGYAMEELVAEVAAAFIGAELGFVPQVMDNHASYLAGWLKVLKEDKRAIFTAASHASKAAEFLGAFSHPADSMNEAA